MPILSQSLFLEVLTMQGEVNVDLSKESLLPHPYLPFSNSLRPFQIA